MSADPKKPIRITNPWGNRFDMPAQTWPSKELDMGRFRLRVVVRDNHIRLHFSDFASQRVGSDFATRWARALEGHPALSRFANPVYLPEVKVWDVEARILDLNAEEVLQQVIYDRLLKECSQ